VALRTKLVICRLKWLKIAKILNFWGKFTHKGTLPISDFYKILHGERVIGPHPSAKFNPFDFKNVGLQPPKSPKSVFLVTICSKVVCPRHGFLPNLACGRVSQDCTLMPNFSALALKMWAKLQKNGNFWYIFGQKGYIPWSNFFYKIWRGEGLPGPHGRANFHHCGFKNVALRPPKSPKIAIFGINFSPRKIYTQLYFTIR